MRPEARLTTKSVTTLVLFGLATYFLFRILLPFLSPILWAITVAIFVFPLQHRLFTFFTLFFLLRDGDQFLNWLLRLMPMHEERKLELIKRVRETIHATVVGNFLVAGAQGTLAGLMLYILGIPAALLWTLVMI